MDVPLCQMDEFDACQMDDFVKFDLPEPPKIPDVKVIAKGNVSGKKRKASDLQSVDKLEAKRKRNRLLAQQSRDRKKLYLQNLEKRNRELESGNQELNEKLMETEKENKVLKEKMNDHVKSSTKKHLVLTLLICVALLIASGQNESIPKKLAQFSGMSDLNSGKGEEVMDVLSEQYQHNRTEIAQSLNLALPSFVVQEKLLPNRKDYDSIFDVLYVVIQESYQRVKGKTREEVEAMNVGYKGIENSVESTSSIA